MFTVKSDTETQKEPLHTPTTSRLGSEHYRDINTLNIPDSVKVNVRNPDREKYFGWYLKTKESAKEETETAESGEERTTASEPDALYLVDPLDSAGAEGERQISEQKKTNITVIHTDELQRAVCGVLFNPVTKDLERKPIQKAESCFLESVYKKPVFEIISNQYHSENKVGCDHSFIGLRYTAYDPFLKVYVRKCIRFGYNGSFMIDTNSAYEGGVQKKIDYAQIRQVFQDITDYFDDKRPGIESTAANGLLNCLDEEWKSEKHEDWLKDWKGFYYADGDSRDLKPDRSGKLRPVTNCFTFARDIAQKMELGEYFEPESEVHDPQSLTDKILRSLGNNRDNAKCFITEEKATARREKRKAPLNAQGALTEEETFKKRCRDLKCYLHSNAQTKQCEKEIKENIKKLQSLLETLRTEGISDGRTISEIKTYCTSIRKQILSLVNSVKSGASDGIIGGYKKYSMLEFARLFSQIKTQLDAYDVNMFLYLGQKPDKTQMKFFDKIGALPSPDVLFERLIEEIKVQMEIEKQELINTNLSSNNFKEASFSLCSNMSNREPEDSFSNDKLSDLSLSDLVAEWFDSSSQDDKSSARFEDNSRIDKLSDLSLGDLVAELSDSSSQDDKSSAPLKGSVQNDKLSSINYILRDDGLLDLDNQIRELHSILTMVKNLIKTRDNFNNGNNCYYTIRYYDLNRDFMCDMIKEKLKKLKKYSDGIPEFSNDFAKLQEELTQCLKTRIERLQKIFSKVFFEKIEQDVYYKYVLPSFYEKWQKRSYDPREACMFRDDIKESKEETPEIVDYFYKPFMDELSKYIEEQREEE